jgi:hypothetical protein
MPATYSVNIGSQFESERKPDIVTVLKNLPDNTSKQISPRDVRDAFLTTWASSPIKQTRTTAGIEYIGIDSGNPADRDIKQKILLGKRGYGNLDAMNSTLLNNSEVDIFIYNTKADNVSQNSTRMGFLAGTYSDVFNNVPYIGSQYNTTTTLIDLDVRNPQLNGGNINLYSTNGYVTLNGIRFPKVSENSSATNGKILRYVGNFPNGYLRWDTSNVTISQLGDPLKRTDIYGGTVSLNGYELEFVNPDMTSSTVGGIPLGFSFSKTSFGGNKWPMSEVIRKLLYPKVGPTISVTASTVNFSTPYVEIGTTASVNFNYDLTIYPRNQYEYISDYLIRKKTGSTVADTIYSGLSFSGIPGTKFTGSADLVAASFSTPTQTDFGIHLTDIWLPTRYTAVSFPNGFSYSATASIYHVWPIYYGFTQSLVNNTPTFNSVVKKLNKAITPYPGLSQSITLPYTGEGYFYIIYHNSFSTPISKVYDSNGFLLHDTSNISTSFFSSATKNGGQSVTGMTTNGQNTTWKVWISGLTCSLTGNNNFTFKF